MTVLRVAAVVLFALLAPVQLAAQPRPRLVHQQQIMNDFAACVWRQAPERARAVMDTTVGSEEEVESLRMVAAISSCSDVPAITGQYAEFRGALAETAIRAEEDRMARIGALQPRAPVRVADGSGRTFVASYASCIAAADPAGSMNLLAATIGSSDEVLAIRQMHAAMTGCMPESASYRVNVRDLRNHIADALYRLSEVPDA